MLQLRPSCECCDSALPPESTEARICSFECTFCKNCVDTVLLNVCPKCGGGLEKRPIRPQDMLVNFPSRNLKIHNPVESVQFKPLLMRYKDILPHKR